ncbi:MAG: DUF4386 domain-containing protein [Anaerolineaceae bacterium]|nr:DUF4386 domain-containing protein [Anaerolineaceae bacterium]
MNTNRKTATIVGILFIIGTVAGILSAVITGPILNSPEYLTEVAANSSQLVFGGLLVLIMGLALAMIPIFMYPIFKKHNESLAVGYVVFRGALETIIYITMVVSWLVLIVLSQEFVKAGIPNSSSFQLLGTVLLSVGDRINPVLQIVFSLGALMFYLLWYQSKLIPRWLSVWGLVGVALYFVAGISALFGVDSEILVAPLALNEMVLAIWLIVKGFNTTPVDTN